MISTLYAKLSCALILASAVSSAPLNERSRNSFKRGLGDGWLCHYDGPADPAINTSLDLPLMLGGLCAKLNYDYDGCDGFRPERPEDQQHPAPPVEPNPSDNLPEVPNPPENQLGAQSASEGEDDQDKHEPKHSEPQKHKPKHSGSQKNKPKKPKHQKSNDKAEEPANFVDPQSFHESNNIDSNEPSHPADASSNEEPHPEPQQSLPQKDPNSSLGSLSTDEDNDGGNCSEDELCSSKLHKCIKKSSFTEPNDDSTCQAGELDAVLNLCLDVSTLGLTEPIHTDSTLLPSTPEVNKKDTCPSGQQLSSLLSVCVDDEFFSDPLSDNECENGLKLDLVLGICLDVAGVQNATHELGLKK